MPYIGRPIHAGDFTPITLTEIFDGNRVDFTMSESVGTVNQLIVILSGVVQHWTDAFTVSGTTLTFSSAPESGETIKILKLGSVLSANVPTTQSVGVGQLSLSGVAEDKIFKVNASNQWELATLQGGNITTEGSFFSNYNAITSDVTITANNTTNNFLKGPITVNAGNTLTIAGSGTLDII